MNEQKNRNEQAAHSKNEEIPDDAVSSTARTEENSKQKTDDAVTSTGKIEENSNSKNSICDTNRDENELNTNNSSIEDVDSDKNEQESPKQQSASEKISKKLSKLTIKSSGGSTTDKDKQDTTRNKPVSDANVKKLHNSTTHHSSDTKSKNKLVVERNSPIVEDLDSDLNKQETPKKPSPSEENNIKLSNSDIRNIIAQKQQKLQKKSSSKTKVKSPATTSSAYGCMHDSNTQPKKKNTKTKTCERHSYIHRSPLRPSIIQSFSKTSIQKSYPVLHSRKYQCAATSSDPSESPASTSSVTITTDGNEKTIKLSQKTLQLILCLDLIENLKSMLPTMQSKQDSKMRKLLKNVKNVLSDLFNTSWLKDLDLSSTESSVEETAAASTSSAESPSKQKQKRLDEK